MMESLTPLFLWSQGTRHFTFPPAILTPHRDWQASRTDHGGQPLARSLHAVQATISISAAGRPSPTTSGNKRAAMTNGLAKTPSSKSARSTQLPCAGVWRTAGRHQVLGRGESRSGPATAEGRRPEAGFKDDENRIDWGFNQPKARKELGNTTN